MPKLKLGKIRGFFGKQGLNHTHAFPFVEPPLAMVNTIGPEGFKDVGVEAAWLDESDRREMRAEFEREIAAIRPPA